MLVNHVHLLLFLDIENIYKVMGELERINKQASDILDCRIEAVLEDMSLTPLCTLPEDDPITIDEFLHLTEQICDEASAALAKYAINLTLT